MVAFQISIDNEDYTAVRGSLEVLTPPTQVSLSLHYILAIIAAGGLVVMVVFVCLVVACYCCVSRDKTTRRKSSVAAQVMSY